MKQVIIENEEKFQINTVRIVACLCIYLCHVFEGYFDVTGSWIGSVGGMFFNVGVPIFFMLSGYLYSTKRIESKEIIKWYLKQFKKLLLPLWIFLLVVFIVHNINGIQHTWIKWLENIIPIIGISESYIPGCGHLWYITDLIICYLLTPVFMAKSNLKSPIVSIGVYMLLKVITAYTIPAIYCTLLAAIGSYLFGFYYLRALKRYFSKIKWMIPIALIVRIVCKVLLDGSLLYNNFLVDLCHKFLAVSIIAMIYSVATILYKYKCLVSITERLSGYTYEFYLVHSPIINGPLSISFTSNFGILGIVGFVLSMGGAYILHNMVRVIDNFFRRK